MIFHSTYSRPILLAGNGARTANAVDMIHEFAHKTNIPVLTTMNAVDIAQDDLHIGFIGTHGNRIANMIIKECDCLISVGARLGLRQVGRITANFAPHAKIVRCDIDEYELSRNITADEKKYHADARDFMRMLMGEDIPDFSSWKVKCLEAKKILDAYDKQEGNRAVEKIASLLPRNPVVAVDVGMNQCWCAQSLTLRGYEGRILISGGYGTMGCGLPYAIGSSIARGNAITYCIVGDGGFQMNIQELETVRRENLPVKMIILNNRVLGKISETQHLSHNDRFANTTAESGYSVPRFSEIAKAYGIQAAQLQSYHELEFYQEFLLNDQPCLLDVALPENGLLTPKIKFEDGIIYPKLDDTITIKIEGILRN